MYLTVIIFPGGQMQVEDENMAFFNIFRTHFGMEDG